MIRLLSFFTVAAAMLTLTLHAPAVVTEQSVGRAFIKNHPKEFVVKAEQRRDGLIHFTVTRKLSEPRYLVAHFSVQDGSTVIAKVDFPAFARDGEATYHLAISPKHLANARFEVSVGVFVDDDTGRPVPLPSGTHYEIQLAEFVPKS